jgi:hypothetical protein
MESETDKQNLDDLRIVARILIGYATKKELAHIRDILELGPSESDVPLDPSPDVSLDNRIAVRQNCQNGSKATGEANSPTASNCPKPISLGLSGLWKELLPGPRIEGLDNAELDQRAGSGERRNDRRAGSRKFVNDPHDRNAKPDQQQPEHPVAVFV